MTPADDRPAPRYQLWRQDDNGNEFLVARFDCRGDAERERLASGGHKQLYWIKVAPCSGWHDALPDPPSYRAVLPR